MSFTVGEVKKLLSLYSDDTVVVTRQYDYDTDAMNVLGVTAVSLDEDGQVELDFELVSIEQSVIDTYEVPD